MVNSAREHSGDPVPLRITMDVPTPRVHVTRVFLLDLVRITAGPQGMARVVIHCHRLFVSGDMLGVRRVLCDRAREAGAPMLVDRARPRNPAGEQPMLDIPDPDRLSPTTREGLGNVVFLKNQVTSPLISVGDYRSEERRVGTEARS